LFHFFVTGLLADESCRINRSVVELALSASTDYPTNAGGPFSNEIALAKSLFEAELASEEGWEDQGIREDVQLMYKRDPLDAYAVPTVKGECIVEGVTPAEVGYFLTPSIQSRALMRA
jgi:hypothetical protein